MKKSMISLIIIIFALAATAVLSQGTTPKTDPKTAPKTEPAAEPKPEPKKETKSKIPDGFGDMQWGGKLNDAKTRVTGRIVYTDEKRKIVT
ncbi:MAG: hypothetical protein MUC95_04800, partial [Spirochaetes bacterium]|nr:hypothetical protein [Spirochaetota bacterium]